MYFYKLLNREKMRTSKFTKQQRLVARNQQCFTIQVLPLGNNAASTNGAIINSIACKGYENVRAHFPSTNGAKSKTYSSLRRR
jgi:hypothetical protein